VFKPKRWNFPNGDFITNEFSGLGGFPGGEKQRLT